jgi:hypothetical protein
MNQQLLALLNSTLGTGIPTQRANVAYHCRFCNHPRPKLEIDLDSGYWHCWVCDAKGRRISSLFKQLRVRKEKLDQLRLFFPNDGVQQEKPSVQVYLPDEYLPMWEENARDYQWATCREYLESRGIRQQDILKYHIGYCPEGRYKEMFIIPNYTKEGDLNHFVARSYRRDARRKFLEPNAPKDIIGFDLQVNWQEPVTIVEAALNAITVRRNGCPIYGKFFSPALRRRIIEHRTPVNMALDPDAMKVAMTHVEYLLGNGISVRLVRFPPDEDPNSLGYETTWEYIEQGEWLTPESLFEKKIRLQLYGDF